MALLAPEARRLRFAARLSVVSGLMWLPLAWLAALSLARLVAGQVPDPRVLAGFVALAGVRAGISYVAEGISQAAALQAIGRLRAGLLLQETRRSELASAGAFASVIAEQLDLVRPYAARYLSARMRVTVLPVVIFLTSASLSWAAGLILLVAGPAVPVFMALIGQAAERASRAQLDQMGTLSATLAERVAALPDIRLLGAKDAVMADFTRAAGDLQQRVMRVLGIAFLSSTVLELFAAIGVAMMAIFCGFSVLGLIEFGMWGGPLMPAQGIFLLLLAPEFFQPLRDLAAVWHDRAAADAVVTVLAERDAVFLAGQDMLGQGGAAPVVAGGLRLRGVIRHGIAYPDFSLAPQETLAITGPSGAGKTTLLRMIAGLERPDQGQILIAGLVLDGGLADGWRASLGWMPQAVHFLDDSLEANLRMGRGGDLTEALSMAAADHLVGPQGLPLSHHLGETGGGVSGGEARRLTLARALLGQPQLVLADEPTADLDALTAEQVADGLMQAHRSGVGLIVATHDPALAALMARQIVLPARVVAAEASAGSGGEWDSGDRLSRDLASASPDSHDPESHAALAGRAPKAPA